MDRNLADLLICPFSRGPLQLEVFDKEGDRIEWGVLHGEGAEFPIISGVPLFELGKSNIVQNIRRGQRSIAAAQACFDTAPLGVLGHLTEVVKDSGRIGRRLGNRMEQWRRRRFSERIAAELFTRDGEQRKSAKALFELGYQKIKRRAQENYHYNYTRFGLPTHFVGLAYIAGMSRTSGYLMDHCCGAGHLTRHIAQFHGRPERVVGYDQSFFSLYVASTCISPGANFVCGHPDAAPFRDGSFTCVLNVDAFLNFSRKWTALNVIERILTSDGEVLLVWLKNSKSHHLYPGKPLTPSAYSNLVQHLPHRVLPDTVTLRRFLDGKGVDASFQAPMEELDRETTFSIWAFKSDPVFQECPPIGAWPQAEGKLAVNPIYRVVGTTQKGVEYELRFPSEFYRDEDKNAKYYYPQRFVLTDVHKKALEANDRVPLDHLIRTGAVLGFPEHYHA